MKLTYGMVGGDLTAFIGEVHRKAINFIDDVDLVSGCFSSDEEKNNNTASHYHIPLERNYKDYLTMAKEEGRRQDKIDFVVIATPNYLHYDIAKAFIVEGIHIVCEKPLCFTVEEAKELQYLSQKHHVQFVVTYTYSGYSMVKYARELIKTNKIGDIITINAEYIQDWLINAVREEPSSSSLSTWRLDPNVSGITNAVGDIGTHIEYTVKYMTGLSLKRVSAKLNRFNQKLDLNANILVEYETGITGHYWCSQVALGHPNGFTIRIYGTTGSITWFQETPDYLLYTSSDGIVSKLTRGAEYVYGNSRTLNKTPKGHPEGYHEAFANIYKVFLQSLKKRKQNLPLDPSDSDFPTIQDGVDGVSFIHAVYESDQRDAKWVALKK